MAILSIFSRSPWRITLSMDVAPSVLVTDYVLARADNGPAFQAITNAFLLDAKTVELCVGATPLDDQLVYTLAYQGGAALAVSYRSPAAVDFTPTPNFEDPEAEALGIDADWLAESLSAQGDLPEIRGKQCAVNDLAIISMVEPSELVHRPKDGGGMKKRVNGPTASAQLKDMQATVKRQWQKDYRVLRNGILINIDTTTSGVVRLNAKVPLVALENPIDVKTPGGST